MYSYLLDNTTRKQEERKNKLTLINLYINFKIRCASVNKTAAFLSYSKTFQKILSG